MLPFKEIEVTMYDIGSFRTEFNNLTAGFSWQIQGFIDQDNKVYPIDSDTKVLSTVFERLASPVMRSIAKNHGYVVEVANQTTYPDFTMSKYDSNGDLLHRIAIDIKTTYIEQKTNKKGFKKTKLTLGSYKSFIRNNTKNILHPYDTYDEHWVLGYVYSRGQGFEEYDMDNMPSRGDINCPYNIESVFIREKVDITGFKPGSGNTANIGSVEIDTPKGFETINGSFVQFSDKKAACDYYWCNFETLKSSIKSDSDLYNHADFLVYK